MKLPNKFNKEIMDWPIIEDEDVLEQYLETLKESHRMRLIGMKTIRERKQLDKILAALEEVNPFYQVCPDITEGLFHTFQMEGMTAIYVHIDQNLYPGQEDQFRALDDLRMQIYKMTKVKAIGHRIWAALTND